MKAAPHWQVGGSDAADAICQGIADGRSLGGTWMAWISNSVSSPSKRFMRSTHPYVLLDQQKTIVADSWADLTDGSLAHERIGDHGVIVDNRVRLDGDQFQRNRIELELQRLDGHVAHQRHGADYGTLGRSDAGWSFTWDYYQWCDVTQRIYCFEQ